MASGRLYTGVVTPYNANPVYDVPNGVSKTAFSLVAQGFNDATVQGTVIYKGNTSASVYDTTSPAAVANFSTAQTFSTILNNGAQFYGLPSDMPLPPSGSFDDVFPFYMSSTKTGYMTIDQKYIFDLTNKTWRSSDAEYGSAATFVIVRNDYSTWSSDTYGILLISDTNPSSSIIYPTNSNTFSISGYGYWDMDTAYSSGARTGRSANLQYAITDTGRLYYQTPGVAAYAGGSSPFSGSNYDSGWNNYAVPSGLSSESLDWAIRYSSTRALGLNISTGQFEYGSGAVGWDDSSWNWTNATFGNTNTNHINKNSIVAYPVNATQVLVFREGGDDTTFHRFNPYSIYAITSVPSGFGDVATAYATSTTVYIRTSNGTLYKASGTTSMAVTEANTPTFRLATELYTSYDIPQVAYSPSLSAGIVSDAFDNNSWLFLANNTTVTTTLQFYSDAGTFDSMTGNITLSGSTTANAAFTTTQNCIVDGDFVASIVTGNEIELKTGYVEIANSVVSEAFNGSTIEITGRMVSANDSIIVYTSAPTKVTIMGIEEEV